MKTRAAITRVLERAYAPEPDERTWLEGIREAAETAFDGYVAAQAVTLRLTSEGRASFASIVGDPLMNDLMVRWHDLADAETLGRLYLSGPTPSVVAVMEKSNSEALAALHQETVSESGVMDFVGSVGTDVTGRICAVSFASPKGKRPSRATRTALSRLAGHLAAAYRLRGADAEDADAVIDPSGKLVHASSGAIADEAGAQLRAAALTMDRSRREAGTDPERALAHWKAMVEGRWTLVERFESDGRRIFVARPNEPATHRQNGLTDAERKVVALAALCHPLKLIGYELGFAESHVSRVLASALTKLGVRSRAELIELHGALVGHDET